MHIKRTYFLVAAWLIVGCAQVTYKSSLLPDLLGTRSWIRVSGTMLPVLMSTGSIGAIPIKNRRILTL